MANQIQEVTDVNLDSLGDSIVVFILRRVYTGLNCSKIFVFMSNSSVSIMVF